MTECKEHAGRLREAADKAEAFDLPQIAATIREAADLIESLSPPDGVITSAELLARTAGKDGKARPIFGKEPFPAEAREPSPFLSPPDGVGLTRYELVGTGGDLTAHGWPNPEGEWVLYEDAAAVIAALTIANDTVAGLAIKLSDARAALAAEQMAYQSVKNALHAAEKREAAYLARGDEWQAVAEKAGVCMSCALGAHEPYGCTDCLNTGWAQGAPPGYVDEAALAAEKARGDGLERAGWTVTGWREKDRPDWFCRATAQLIADQYREARAALSVQPGD